jgi:hypothetical protein
MTTVAVVMGAAWMGVTAAMAAAPAPTRAELAEAHKRFQRATELYEENNFAGALAEFRRAYAIAPNYKVLYNIGQLCFLVQDYPCAYESFGRYLSEGAGDVSTERRQEVQRDLARLQGRVARLRIVADRPGAEVTVDNVAVGKTPLDEAVVVAAGRPVVRVTLHGYAPFTRVVEVAGMETSKVDVELVPLGAGGAVSGGDGRAAGLSARASGDGATSGPVPVTPWVITGALAVAAGTTGALALWSSADLKKRREEVSPTSAEDLDAKASRTRRLALATDILIGSTVVAAGIATYLTLTSSSSPPSPGGKEGLSVSVGPGSIGLGGRF